MTEWALEVERYSVSLGGREILRNITFSVSPRERVAVIGPNGAGKTTLLKGLCRIQGGGRGRIRLGGLPLERFQQLDLARRLAYVPQAEGGSAPYTVREFVEMARYPHLGPLAPVRGLDRTAIDQALRETGIVSLSSRPLGALSGGERQKALLAAALAQEADILLLDEPTAFLDPPHRREILDVLARLQRDRGTTILSVTHDVNEALAHSDRVLALREGTLVFDGPSAALASGETLRRVYEHDFVVGVHPRSGRPVLFPD